SPFMFAFGQSVLVAGGAPDQPQFVLDERGQETLTVEEVMSSRAETWENVKEARMVPREKAAFAYTETVRRRVDPALMEWSGAGIFSARVFPLAPKKLHRIVIGYDVDLIQAGDDLEYRFDLPEGVARRVVDISVAELEGVQLKVTGETEGERASGRLHYRFEDPDVRTITVRQKSPGTIMLVGKDKTGSYFATRFRPELPKAEATGGTASALFLVDTSLSSNPGRMNIWLKLVKALLDNNRDSLRAFAVCFFNIETHWWQTGFAQNTPANVQKLLGYADDLALEGATDIGAVLREVEAKYGSLPNDGPLDVFLLSDGAATWGETNMNAALGQLGGGSPKTLFAYTTGLAGTDTKALNHLARESGGAVFNVVGEAEIEAASRAHRSRPSAITGFSLEPGPTRDLLLAGRPRTVFAGQHLLMVGKHDPDFEHMTPPPPPAAHLALRRDGASHSVSAPIRHRILSDLAVRMYGQVATGGLEEFHELDDATEDVAEAYARHFRVTGKTCSLLMLESEADYKRFDIKPEEDAFVVKSSPASGVIAKAIAAIGDSLADAKKRFTAWLSKLERMPGFEFKAPAALKLALDRMPRESFTVAPKPLVCMFRKWDQIRGPVQEMLVSKKLDYDAITKEAERRLSTIRQSAGLKRDAATGREVGGVDVVYRPADALKALSSLVENSPGDGVLARDVAFSAMEWGLDSQAYYLLRRVASSRPYEPQTYRALAQVLAKTKNADLAIAYYEVALAGKWHSRFGAFREIVGLDYLRFLKQIEAGKVKTSVPDFAKARLETVAKEFDKTRGKGADFLVTITWNTDSTDIDLHVKEPTGEECYYKHTKTKIGGRITQDVTQGYGPEMYVLPRAVAGRYQVRVKFYSQNRNRASARTKVYATVYQDWGRATERVALKVDHGGRRGRWRVARPAVGLARAYGGGGRSPSSSGGGNPPPIGSRASAGSSGGASSRSASCSSSGSFTASMPKAGVGEPSGLTPAASIACCLMADIICVFLFFLCRTMSPRLMLRPPDFGSPAGAVASAGGASAGVAGGGGAVSAREGTDPGRGVARAAGGGGLGSGASSTTRTPSGRSASPRPSTSSSSATPNCRGSAPPRMAPLCSCHQAVHRATAFRRMACDPMSTKSNVSPVIASSASDAWPRTLATGSLSALISPWIVAGSFMAVSSSAAARRTR
ncbi:MAG: hypothetical protein ACYS9X_28500, partial [Planctomycetota bacterium]